MRTTISIDDDLLRDAKQMAARRGTSLTALVEDALRQALAVRQRDLHPSLELPAFRGRVQPGVDLDDSAALLDLMEDRQ